MKLLFFFHIMYIQDKIISLAFSILGKTKYNTLTCLCKTPSQCLNVPKTLAENLIFFSKTIQCSYHLRKVQPRGSFITRFQHLMSPLQHLHFSKGAFVFLQAYGALTFGIYSQTMKCNLQLKYDWATTARPVTHKCNVFIRHDQKWCPAWLCFISVWICLINGRDTAARQSTVNRQRPHISLALGSYLHFHLIDQSIPPFFTLTFSVCSDCWRGYRVSGGRSVWCTPITR